MQIQSVFFLSLVIIIIDLHRHLYKWEEKWFERPEGRLSKQTGAPGFMTKRTSATRNQPQSASSAHKKKTNPTGTLSIAALGEVHNSCDGQHERQVA